MTPISELELLRAKFDEAGDMRQNHIHLAPIMEATVENSNVEEYLALAFNTREHLASIGIVFPSPEAALRTQTLQAIDTRLVRARSFMKQGFIYV